MWNTLLLVLTAPLVHVGSHERLVAAEALIAERPLDAAPRVQHAAALREHGEFARALEDLETARRLDPCAAELERERGACLLGQGRDAEAEAAFTLALEAAPRDALAHRLRAEARARCGELAAALEDRAAVARLVCPPEPDVVLELARAQLAVGATADALATLDRGIEQLGLAPALVLCAIECEEQRAHVDAALARVDAWGRTLPRKEQAFVLRGEIQERAGRLEEAARAWQSALRSIDALGARQKSAQAALELAARARAGLARIARADPPPVASIRSQR